jgi:hypothetical protein
MGKNRKRARNQHPFSKRDAPPAPRQTATRVSPESPKDAIALITTAYDGAVADAQEADIEHVASSPPAPDTTGSDLTSAARMASEALALCRAREDRLTRRESEADEQATLANSREAELDQRESKLAEQEMAVEEQGRELEERARELLEHERSIRQRELNAEAGFITERRESLRLLDEEAAAMHDKRAHVRAQISEEREKWNAERQLLDERLRKEHQDALEAERAIVESERNELRTRSLALSEQRRVFSIAKSQLEVDLDILREDREAFDERVARRAAGDLERAKAKQEALEAQLASARADRDSLYQRLQQRESAMLALGRSPEEVKHDLDVLTQERDALKATLATRPSQEATERLAALERSKEHAEAERGRLIQELAIAKGQVARAAIAVTEIETLRDQKAALETAREATRAALEDLQTQYGDLTKRNDSMSAFPSCSAMDLRHELQTRTPAMDEIPDLESFCQDLRHRIAVNPDDSDTVLYYSSVDVRCFVAGLAMSKLHLLQGISGTGKTSLPQAVARALGTNSRVIEVQAGWRDRQDLIGHFNAFEHKFSESEFLQALYEAQCPKYEDLPYMIVLDEMNLSHPEQYFADLLSILERKNDQTLNLMTSSVASAPALLLDGRKIRIPPNVWFIGTANHDETTKDFADKTYDRAHVMELPRGHESFKLERHIEREPVSFQALQSAFRKAKKENLSTARDAYTFLESSFADILGRRFGVGWGNRLDRQMQAFVPVVVASGGSVGEAVDHILATKLLRKVRDRHDTREEDLNALRERVTEAWPTLDAHNPATKSDAILRDELRRLGAEAET